jgi:photosystem II stability/assembly factor-like uncharacterized protein
VTKYKSQFSSLQLFFRERLFFLGETLQKHGKKSLSSEKSGFIKGSVPCQEHLITFGFSSQIHSMKKLLLVLGAALVSLAVFALLISSKKEVSKKSEYTERKTAAWDALQFMNTSNAYPGKDIPEDAFTRGYEDYKERFANTALRNMAATTWQNIGPNNLGGRTLCMAFDPVDTSIIWLGSAGGGLWKSNTGGRGVNAWTYVPTGFPVRGVSAVVINPNNRDEMYIGTGETYSYATTVNGLVHRPTRGTVGIGILKSTDRGLTWSHVLNWSYSQKRGIWEIAFNPLNTNTLYAATTEGVYKTTNGGATWAQVLNQQMVMDLDIDPVDTNIVYAGVGNVDSPAKGIYKTSNSGASWTLLTNGLPAATYQGRITLALNPLNHKTVYALIADLFSTKGFYRSRDQGNTWTAVNTTYDIVSYQGWYANGLLMKSNDSTRFLFAGVDVHITTNSGSTINPINGNVHSDIHGIYNNPLNPNKIYILTDGGLFRSDNFGTSCYECTDGYVTSQFYIGSTSPFTPNLIIAGAQDNYTNVYNGTLYWDPIIGGDGSFNAINHLNDNTQFASYQYLNILRTDDDWFNYDYVFQSPSSSQGGNPAAFIAPFVLSKKDTAVLYAGSNYLNRSNDGGATWSTPFPGLVDNGKVILSMGLSSTNVDSLYFATVPSDTGTGSISVFRSTNGGSSFTNITGTLPDRYPRAIAVNPKKSNELFIVFSGFGTGHVYKSINAGNTWTNMTGTLPDLPFHTVAYLPATPDTVFVGSDAGVFCSMNGGSSWFALNTGLPDGVLVFDLKYSSIDNSLVAFTHGNGIYKASLNNLTIDIAETPSFVHDFTQSIFSNPAHDYLQIMINSGVIGSALVSVYDINGRLVKETTHEAVTTGKNNITIDIKSLSSGTYILKTDLGGESKSTKFVVMD